MIARAPEWIVAVATILATSFVGYQSLLFRKSLETPYSANLQVKAIEVCGGLRTSYTTWSQHTRFRFLVASDAFFEELLEGRTADEEREIGSRTRESHSEASRSLKLYLTQSRYILAERALIDEIDQLMQIVEREVLWREILTDDEIASILEQQDSGKLQKVMLSEDELVSLDERFESAIMALDEFCLASTFVQED